MTLLYNCIYVPQADVLETADFKPSSCPEKEVQVVDGACHSTLWIDQVYAGAAVVFLKVCVVNERLTDAVTILLFIQYSAINSLRRLLIYHHGLLIQNGVSSILLQCNTWYLTTRTNNCVYVL